MLSLPPVVADSTACFRASRRLRRRLTSGDAQHRSHSLAVLEIGFVAVADMTDLDFPGRIAHGSGGVAELGFLLFLGH